MREKKKNKRILGSIILMIFILILFSIGSSFLGKQEKLGIVKGATSTIKICYYQKNSNRAYEIEEGMAMQSICVCKKGGTVTEFKKNGEELEFSEGEVLEEGDYTITVANDREQVTRNFKIDNTAPLITGIKTSVIRETVIITFENIEDVVSATLELPKQAKKVDLYELYIKNKLEQNEDGKYIYIIEYNEQNKGTYQIEVKDAADNIYTKIFGIR